MIRATVAVTVTASSGEMLKLLVVFKGKPGTRIKTREFPTYPTNNAYACQETTWMDKRVMLMWVRTILKPFVEDCPINIQPLLLLDSYKCHTMASCTNMGAHSFPLRRQIESFKMLVVCTLLGVEKWKTDPLKDLSE